MDLETAQTTTTAKLPILKQGEYDMWRLKIKQYFQVQDYAIWDVIENRNSFKPVPQIITNVDGSSTSLIPGPVTTEEKVQKKNDVKARSMLLMALPNEHLMTFNQYKDAQTLFAAIQTRFGGNEATKKTQKTLLKQMYENFSAPSTESLDSIFNRLQKIVSQLAILGENISQEDLNLKFLRSLPSEWNTHVVVWRNKPDLDTMSFDDLYNNFKIVEQEVKGTASSSSSSSSQNMAFVSSPSSTNEVNTAYGVSTANTQVSPASTQDLEQIHEDDIEEMDLNWQLALLSMRKRKYFQKTSRNITIKGSDIAGYDKSKVECFNCHKMGHFARKCRGPRNQDSGNRNEDNSRRTINVEETSSKAIVVIDGAGFDWSYMADDEVPTNMALIAFSDSELHFKRGLASVEEQLVFYKKNEVIFYEQLAVLKRDISYKDSELNMLKSELEKRKQEKESNQLKIEKFDNASKKEFQQPEFEGYGPKTSKNVSEDTSNEVRESPDAPMVEKLASDDKLEKKTVFPTLAKIEFVRPKQQEKPVRKPVSKSEIERSKQSPRGNQRNWNNQKSQQLGSNFVIYNKACFVCGSFDHVQAHYNYRQRERVESRNNYTRVNAIKASACWVWRPTKLNSALITLKKHNYVDAQANPSPGTCPISQTSRNLMEDMLPLGEEPKEGKLLVKELLKLIPDESSGFYLSSRKNNMYSVDMKNIVPKESLTCLVAKATLDESMLWHRRLGKATQSLLFTWVFFLATKDETSGILKSFITKIENLVDKKVKIIRCDNGTEFKNKVMSKFCEQKSIKREFSVARTPQQNGVAERRNKTLIEADRTIGRTPALSFMRPFRCHVTILNTLDYLGKFDGKSDEGFFVGYSMNSKAFRVYNIRTRKVEENLHIRFLEDKPIIAGTNSNDLVDVSLFDSLQHTVIMDEPQPSSDARKKDDECVNKESGIADQEKSKSNTQGVNTAGPIINTEPNMFSLGDNATLEATHTDFFGDETEVDMSNITTTYPVPSTPNTRIHKDHSLDHVIGDV
ncbi:ribonuclease H-like domain-containing protein [Tanacetum coccineum]